MKLTLLKKNTHMDNFVTLSSTDHMSKTELYIFHLELFQL